jgi:hypothetical protein
VLVHRYAPVRSRGPRARSTCPAASAARPGAGSAPSARPPRFRDRVTDETRPPVRPARARRAATKSFIYHFVVKALLSLI